jgi:two-component system chemotaxis sensor kinase CheA
MADEQPPTDETVLKAKALLLIRCERELYALRMKHEQTATWLQLAQSLPALLTNREMSMSDVVQRVRRALIGGLRVQRLEFLEVDGATLRSLTPPGRERPLSREAAALIEAHTCGFCNEPVAPDEKSLAESLGLHRFVWSRISVAGRLPILVTAGFDRTKAVFQSPYEESDAAHFGNATQHVQALLGNFLLTERLRATNETLELRVRERTSELAQRHRDMRRVLDNVHQALLTIDREGRLAPERSAVVDRWFGAYEGSPLFVDHLARIDAGFAGSFAVGFEALLDDVLPRDLCLAQLPANLHSAGRQFRLTYLPLLDEECLTGLLIVADDVTERVRRAQEEAEQGEMLGLFQEIMRDRSGHLRFADDADQIIEQLAAPSLDDTARLRLLHTLKGNASMAGARFVAALCGQAEDQLSEGGLGAAEATLVRLRERWAVVTHTLSAVLGDRHRERGMVEIQSQDIERLCDDVRQGARGEEIVERLTRWRHEPVARVLARMARYARALAQRLGRGDLEIAIEAPEARLDLRRLDPLWSVLVHVVRNAVDHGIEPLADRAARGKTACARLGLRARLDDGAGLVIEVEDDGRGIDWERVRASAAARGLPHASDADLFAALLSPGVTTRDMVTATSGRGIGLAAVSEYVTSAGGHLTVRSQAGAGTCWRISIPLPAHSSSPAPAPAPAPAGRRSEAISEGAPVIAP